jgi:hypothetical protein
MFVDNYQIAGIVLLGLVVGLMRLMEWASRPQPQPEDECVEIKWLWQDVQMLRPDLSEDDAHNMLMRIGDSLHARSVEFGWEVMEYLIRMESE